MQKWWTLIQLLPRRFLKEHGVSKKITLSLFIFCLGAFRCPSFITIILVQYQNKLCRLVEKQKCQLKQSLDPLPHPFTHRSVKNVSSGSRVVSVLGHQHIPVYSKTHELRSKNFNLNNHSTFFPIHSHISALKCIE